MILSATGIQAQKIAHVNYAELLSMMDGVKAADAALQKYANELETMNQKMLSEYQTKRKDYEQKSGLMTDLVRETTEKEIFDLEARIQEFQQSAPQKIQEHKEEKYKPIFEKAKAAVQEVAKEKGYDYVFDISLGSILFAKDSYDILGDVKKKLDIQ